MSLRGLRVALVGPLPPPEGGMANYTRGLAELLEAEGACVSAVRVNAPYRPAWVGRIRGLRALFRLLPYAVRLWRAAGEADVIHVMANSGWSWHLFAAPALWIARLRAVPSIVNYHGGEAEAFLERSGAIVRSTLARASALAVPSGYLQQVFGKIGIASAVVPNFVDLSRFRPARDPSNAPLIVVARNLDPIYDIATALRAFALLRAKLPDARLSIAGSGPQEKLLRALAVELGVADAVRFRGRLSREDMAELYRSAALALNPSRVDNMPISVLEAMASGVPVVSTDVGGIPFVLQHGVTGLLVAPGNPAAMAAAAFALLSDAAAAGRMRDAALAEVQRYGWTRVRACWSDLYLAAVSGRLQGRPA